MIGVADRLDAQSSQEVLGGARDVEQIAAILEPAPGPAFDPAAGGGRASVGAERVEGTKRALRVGVEHGSYKDLAVRAVLEANLDLCPSRVKVTIRGADRVFIVEAE